MEAAADSREKERGWMVQHHLKNRGILDEKVLDAMQKTERHRFVPSRLRSMAYADQPLPIGEDQTISQPYVVAFMLQALNLRGSEKVLDIGTGSGYATALLSLLVREVYTVEIRAALAAKAKEIIESLGLRNVFFKVGDGFAGWAEHAPFDVIFISACLKRIPAELMEQLVMGGKLLAPVLEGKSQVLVLLRKTPEGTSAANLGEVTFVPAAGGFSAGEK